MKEAERVKRTKLWGEKKAKHQEYRLISLPICWDNLKRERYYITLSGAQNHAGTLYPPNDMVINILLENDKSKIFKTPTYRISQLFLLLNYFIDFL